MAESGWASTVSKILVLQILAICIVSSGFFLMGSWRQFVSSALGGLVGFLPNIYFALRVTSAPVSDAKKVVRSFYAGETGKLLLTALLFYLVFQLPGIELLPLLAGFAAVLSVFWFALLMRV
ncbi:MAG: ATP synthase subunit I [Gammaproteobacteria bacterium]